MIDETLDQAYAKITRDEEREAEALAWVEALIGDVNEEDEARA